MATTKTKAKPRAKRTTTPKGPLPVVRYGQVVTKNIGNYESFKIDVGLEIPAEGYSDDDISNALERAKKIVGDEMREQVEAVKEHVRQQGES